MAETREVTEFFDNDGKKVDDPSKATVAVISTYDGSGALIRRAFFYPEPS